jgi:hypothetical protein
MDLATMALKLACPRCQHVHFFDDASAGQPATCEKCEQPFRVPRLTEAVEEPAAPAGVPWPWPGQYQARELPTTFTPLEPLAAKVVPLPPAPVFAGQRRQRDDDSGPPIAGARRGSYPAEERARRAPTGEPSRAPWAFGVTFVVLTLLLFAGTATWFMLHEHRPPQQPFQKAGVAQFQFQPAPPMPPMQPQFGPGGPAPFPPIGPENDPRKLKGQQDPILLQPNEQVTALKLENGQAKVNGAINRNDPLEPFHPGCHRKIYTVQLEAKRSYLFELNMDPPRLTNIHPQGANDGQGFALDPYLIVEDEQGNVLDWNDDVIQHFNLNSRVPKFQAPKKGTYRLIATSFAPNQSGKFVLIIRDLDMGTPVAAKALAAVGKLPEPTEPKTPLKPQVDKVRNLQITTLLTSDAAFIGDMCWSADGKAFFTLDETGTLRRVALSNPPTEEKRLELGRPATSLAMSKEGLLVALTQLEEVWVIDPATLAVGKRISAPGLQRVVAAPPSSFAFAAAKVKSAAMPVPPPQPNRFAPPAGVVPATTIKDGIIVLDLVAGSPIRQYDYSSKNAAITPDGKYLFAEGGIEQLVRYRIQNGEISLDEESPKLAANATGIFVSPDSQYVCMAAPTGNYPLNPDDNVGLFIVHIFKTGDLRSAAFSANIGEAPRTIGFDPQAGYVFAHNNDKQFMEFAKNGARTLEMNLPGDDRLATEPRQFLAHPAGFRLLIRAEHTIYQIDLPQDEKN